MQLFPSHDNATVSQSRYQHDHGKPIGRVNNITVDKKGIFVEASVSDAAEKQHAIKTLIKDGVLKSFSVGFRIKDADYDKRSDTFVIKDLELLEISVVSVPANQNSLFSIRKSFESDDSYKEFKGQFAVEEVKASKVLEQDDEEAGQTVDTEDSTAEHEGEVGDEKQSTETEESDETAEQNS